MKALAVTWLSLMIGCGASASSSSSCVAGRTVSCACAGGATGTQTCTTAGSYGACQCPGGARPVTPLTHGKAGTTPVEGPITEQQAEEAGLPHIKTIDPSSGPSRGGSLVAIVGSGFASRADSIEVKFGQGTAKIMAIEGDQKIVVQTPAGPSGESVDVKVVFDDAELVFPKSYTYE